MTAPIDRPVPAPLTVFYDGACPLCRREIAVHRAMRPRGVRWVNVAAPGAAAVCPLDPADLLKRFHVRGADGRMASGARAFIALWRRVPRLAPLGRLAAVPPLPTVLEAAYRLFLPLRPRLQAWAQRRKAAALRRPCRG